MSAARLPGSSATRRSRLKAVQRKSNSSRWEGQRVHEIELPRELEGIDSVLDLHKAVEAEYTFDPNSGKLTRNKGASA
jgi:hypothetical protein